MSDTITKPQQEQPARKRGPRHVLINFLVSEEERDQIRQDAKRNGLGVSSLIRAALAFFRQHH